MLQCGVSIGASTIVNPKPKNHAFSIAKCMILDVDFTVVLRWLHVVLRVGSLLPLSHPHDGSAILYADHAGSRPLVGRVHENAGGSLDILGQRVRRG